MDIRRIVVLIWLSLPILVYLINRYLLKGAAWQYRSTTKGSVTGTSMVLKTDVDGSQSYASKVAYTYRDGGSEYTATGEPIYWGEFKAGDTVKIRYNPKSPQESRIWHPKKAWGWIITSLIWLSLALGIACFILTLGSLSIVVVAAFSKRIIGQFQPITPRMIVSGFAVGIFIIFFAFLTVEWGVEVLANCGMVGQNWLWALWTHQGLCAPA